MVERDFYVLNKILEVKDKLAGTPYGIRLSSIEDSIRVNATENMREKILNMRNTTKKYPPLADLLRNHKGSVNDFIEKVQNMSLTVDADTPKDRLIKDIYNAFARDIKKKSTDELEEIVDTNKEADKLIAEVDRAARVSDDLIKKIEAYKRKY